MIDEKIASLKIINTEGERDLWITKKGFKFWLSKEENKWVDKCIRESGEFEEFSTRIVEKYCKKGDTVLDIGSNIGYYTIIMSELVGNKGKVLSFEPTKIYGNVLKLNIKENNLLNTKVFDFGLSNKELATDINIGVSSATLHSPDEIKSINNERIELKVLDEIINNLQINNIDFIKIDVDGHEPFFLEGSQKTLDKYTPIILLEINHLNYWKAGFTAWDFYNYLKNKGYYIFSEKDEREYKDIVEFLMECGNFSYSANIIICKNKKLVGKS